MKTSYIVLIVIAAIALLIGGFFISAYNNFVGLQQDINGKWSEVENQYQRQYDLIGNLVDVVSSSVKVETNFVQNVVDARTKYQNALGALQRDQAGLQMSNGVTAFVNSVTENYPTLQANKQYTTLTDELAGTQNRISVARGRYISSIQSFNTAIKVFPSNIIAGLFRFGIQDYYTAQQNAMQTPVLGNGTLP